MSSEKIPAWLAQLEGEEIAFIKNFILASGSLKEIASQYRVTYPTVRLRLDRLILRIQNSETQEQQPYVNLIKKLAFEEKIDFDTAKILIQEYRNTKEGSSC